MEITQKFTTNNPCYRENKQIVPKGLMLHSVGCAQPNAYAFTRTWNKKNSKVGVHAIIDANTGEVTQCLPWTLRGWHAGGEANNGCIGVEMCESDGIKYTKGASFEIIDLEKAKKHAVTAYKSAVELFAFLCKNFNLVPERDIISHYEASQMGIASNHVDPEHYWKGLSLPYTMDVFREDVKNEMNKGKKETVSVENVIEKTNEDEVSKKIWNALITAGFSKTGTAGIIGNLYAESGLNPKNLQNSFNTKFKMTDEEYTNRVDAKTYHNFVHDGAGYGLAQWTFRTRKQELLSYCRKIGKSIGDLDAQLDFMLLELSGYKLLVEKLKQNISLYEATKLFLTIYEKPADMSENAVKKRLTYATKYYNIYVNEHMYRVRQEWTMTGTQKGAFRNLTNAINLAKKYGYKVFDETGKCVYK